VIDYGIFLITLHDIIFLVVIIHTQFSSICPSFQFIYTQFSSSFFFTTLFSPPPDAAAALLLLLKILPKGLKLLWLGCFDELQIVVVLGHVPAIAAAAKPPISSCLLFHEPKQNCITEEFSQRKNLKRNFNWSSVPDKVIY
jgi:hypothetical protein